MSRPHSASLAVLQWLCLVVLAATLGAGVRAGAGEPSVKLLTFSGRVEISRREGTWDPAYTNQVLLTGDRLRTASNARATIRLSDGTIMRVGAEASFEVPEGRRGVTINPLRGLYYFFHRDKAGDFDLRSKSTAAAVRGTEFQLEAGEDGTWRLSVLEGAVTLQTSAGELDLGTGQAGLARPGQKPGRMVMRPAAELIQWFLYYPAVLDSEELELTPAEREQFKDSLSAYREGDAAGALARCPGDGSSGSDSAEIYRAALAISAGQVPEARRRLDRLSPAGGRTARISSLKTALAELVAVVLAEPPVRKSGEPPGTASEWLAQSYRLQSESKLSEALAAAREAVRISPSWGLGWERAAELEFSFGRVDRAQAALGQALSRSPRAAQTRVLQGFLFAARDRIAEALRSFEDAIVLDGGQSDAWLGRGLCRIRLGQTAAGREDLLVAAALEPQRSVLRSYLGKAFALGGDYARARKELGLAEALDPHDPTAWLYSALLSLDENRINEAIDALEKSAALNQNRSLFRSQLLLDQDRAVRGANLAAGYQDAGMNEVAVREATRAVESDYANYSAHLFLANSYNALRDPQQVNLRYESAWLDEYLMANLLSPVGANTLSPLVSQQEYSRLFDQNGLGLASETDYSSRGDWTQSAVQQGVFNHTAYAVEETYRSQNGYRSNDDLRQLTVSTRLKQQITPADTLYLQTVYYDANAGDLAQYYNPASADTTLRIKETQQPLLLAGYHHEWAPGVDTLLLAGRLQDTLDLTSAQAPTLFLSKFLGQYASLALYDQTYQSEQTVYVSELQQLVKAGDHTLVLGARFQTGRFDTDSLLQNGVTFPAGTPTGPNPIDQHVGSDFQRVGGYAYDEWRPVDPLLVVGGIGYDTITYPDNFRFAPITTGEDHRNLFGPKGGLVWTPAPDTTFRAAYSRSLGGVGFDQSFRLEPAQVAGFNQAFRSLMPESVVGSVSAAAFELFGLQWEQKLPTRTYLGASAQLLRSDARRSVGEVVFDIPFGVPVPNPFQPASTSQLLQYEERTLLLTVNQLAGDDFAFGVSYQLSRARLDSSYPDIPAVGTVAAPLSLSQSQGAWLHQVRLYGVLNHPSGFFCGAEGLWTSQQNDGYSPDLPGDSFWQINLFGGYRWWHRHAEARLALLNLAGHDYNLNPLNVTADLPHERTLTASFRFSF